MTAAAAAPSFSSIAGLRRLQPAAPRLSGVLLAALGAGGTALLAILAMTGMSLAAEFGNFVLLAGGLGAVAGYCHWRGHPWRLTDSAAIVSLVPISLLLCGLISCTGLRLGFPLADSLLARADALAGFDVSRVSSFVATQTELSWILQVLYNASGPLCAAAIGWNLLRKDRELMWRVVATLVISMQIVAIVSVLFPAQGASVWMGLDALQGSGLPYGAGTYSAVEFMQFYSGSDLLVQREDMNGIVCFPSFHTVMALVILQGFVTSPLKWLALPVSAMTIVSTVPMGGHYVIDLAGGFLVWLLACSLAAWACRFLKPVAPTAS